MSAAVEGGTLVLRLSGGGERAFELGSRAALAAATAASVAGAPTPSEARRERDLAAWRLTRAGMTYVAASEALGCLPDAVARGVRRVREGRYGAPPA